MKKAPKSLFDVFIAYSEKDKRVALKIKRLLEIVGLQSFVDLSDVNWSRPTLSGAWDALAESRSVIAILGKQSDENAFIAIGAAQAWSKPSFIVYPPSNPPTVDSAFHRFQLFSTSELDRLVAEVVKSQKAEPLPGQEILVDAYLAIGIPTDQLPILPGALDRLKNKVKQLSGKSYAPELILRELVRLRKKGVLPRLIS